MNATNAHAQNVHFCQWTKTTPRAEGYEVVPETNWHHVPRPNLHLPRTIAESPAVQSCQRDSFAQQDIQLPPHENHQPRPVGDSLARSLDLRCQPISLVWATRAVKKVSKQFALMGTEHQLKEENATDSAGEPGPPTCEQQALWEKAEFCNTRPHV